MRTVPTLILASVAAIGLTGLALAAGSMHEMTVQVPGGGVAHVRYSGDVAPKITFVQGEAEPFAAAFWAPDSPFAELDRISALMDRQMAQMMYQARLMQMQASDPLYSATLKDAPAGTSGYTVVSTMSGNGFCMHSTQITSSPNGGAPKVVTKTSGSCGNEKTNAAPSHMNAAPAAPGLQTISFKSMQPTAPARHGI